ncbi:MAG: hypothetical protein EXR99_08680 [Gemmataceae bacterium]|nr:hypothetical protein [Gemmataceae bacterium]
MANLVSAIRVKAVIAQAAFSTAEEALVASLCAVVSSLVRSFTQRELDAGIYEEWVSGSGGKRLLVRHYPIVAVASVFPRGSGVEISGYEVERSRGILWRNANWSKGERNLRVTYTAGFDPLPEDLVEACAQWAAALFWQSKDNPAETPHLPPLAIRQALSPYRRRSW